MSYTMEQFVRSGMPFNPLGGPQGVPFAGRSVVKLQDALKMMKSSDPRFVSVDDIEKGGYQLKSEPLPHKVMERGAGGTWVERSYFHASDVVGLPTLDIMVQNAKEHVKPKDGLEVAGFPAGSALTIISKSSANTQGNPATARPVEWLNKAYVEREPGSGRYFADGASTPDFVLDGERIVISEHAGRGAVEAACELADLKGWSGVGVAADSPNLRSAAWAFASLRGLDVPGYTPEDWELHERDLKRMRQFDRADEVQAAPLEIRPSTLLQQQEPATQGNTVEEEPAWEPPPAPDVNLPKQAPALRSLLDSKFSERVAGSGLFYRDGVKDPAIVDKGASVVVHDKESDSYQAVMELAKSKGWEAIELSGKPQEVAKGWLQAELAGIKVTNYTPSQQDLEKLAAARTAVAIQNAGLSIKPAVAPSQAGAAQYLPTGGEVSGIPIAQSGSFFGSIKDVRDGYAIQATGRGGHVAHALSSMSTTPNIGESWNFQYEDGKPGVLHSAANQEWLRDRNEQGR